MSEIVVGNPKKYAEKEQKETFFDKLIKVFSVSEEYMTGYLAMNGSYSKPVSK